jgi:glycosyltransferase involved in cell wall biosynthesis
VSKLAHIPPDSLPRDQRPHLLLIESIPTIAGGQAAMVQLASGWHDALKISALLPGPGPLADALTSQGVTCFFAEQGDYTLLRKTRRDVTAYARRLPRLIFTTTRLIREQGIDMLYANSARTFAWAALAATLARRPVLWHHHALLADAKTLHLVTNVARLPAVRRVICSSSGAQAQFASVAAKTVVIPYGINTDRFAPNPAARQTTRQSLGLGPDQLVVGMVGDLIPLKGQDTLIKALQSSPDSQDLPPVTTLLIGGPRPGEAESEAYAAHLQQIAGSNVRFLGRRSDIPDLLNAIDLLVVASSRETGPLVLLESLACTTPALSTPVGISPDLLPADAIFPVGDVQALRAALQRWLADPARRASVGTTGRTQVIQELSLPSYQSRVLAEIHAFLP